MVFPWRSLPRSAVGRCRGGAGCSFHQRVEHGQKPLEVEASNPSVFGGDAGDVVVAMGWCSLGVALFLPESSVFATTLLYHRFCLVGWAVGCVLGGVYAVGVERRRR